jgi:hypothetical protein
VDPPHLAQLFIGVSKEPGAVMACGVRQKDFRGQARSGNLGVFEKLPALEQRGMDGQAASLCSLSFSVW